MRLIDADAVAEAINDEIEIAAEMGTHEASVCKGGLIMGLAYVNTAPTIDAVPVVRCKVCKWCEAYGYAYVCHNPRYGDGYANYQPPHIDDEYWCADGERKDDE